MKHNLKITAILLSMFIITQIIGLVVLTANPLKINSEINGTMQEVSNPYLKWVEPPEPETQQEFTGVFSQLVFAFILAVLLLFVLMKFKWEVVLKFWFFAVVIIALFLAFVALGKLIPIELSLKTSAAIALVLAIPLAFMKIYGRNLLIHNFTEFLIYPGIAVVFVPLLNPWTMVALLIVISIYDMWAVWRSGIMQKMAKFHINTLKIFPGFFVPYMSKKVKMALKKTKDKSKKVKVNVAILGGGDIIFPIITAGVMLKAFGLLSAILVIIGATLGLAYLFFFAEKKKFYPAMPFISAGIFLGMLINLILVYL